MFEKWILHPKNSTLSKSLSRENECRSRVQDLMKVLKWRWPRTRSPVHAAAQELSDVDQRWVSDVVQQYIEYVNADLRRAAVAALKRVLGEALGKAKAKKGPVSLGQLFWTFREDGKQRLNTRSEANNALYYKKFRDWLEDRGYLRLMNRGLKGQHGNTYMVCTAPGEVPLDDRDV